MIHMDRYIYIILVLMSFYLGVRNSLKHGSPFLAKPLGSPSHG